MAVEQPTGASAWIVVSPDFHPLVSGHIDHAGSSAPGEAHEGDDWREAVAWARARTDRVFIRFDFSETTYWAGAGPPPPGGDPPVQPLPERPMVFVDEWIAELQSLRRRLAHLEAAGQGTELAWTMYVPPRQGAVRQVRVGAGELHRIAAFWAAVTGGTVERAAVFGRMVDWAPRRPGWRPPRAAGQQPRAARPGDADRRGRRPGGAAQVAPRPRRQAPPGDRRRRPGRRPRKQPGPAGPAPSQ